MLYSFYLKNLGGGHGDMGTFEITATPHIEILFTASKNINTVNPHVPCTKVRT